MTKEELYVKRDEIMERFDFEKVLAHMEQVDWKWQSGSEYRVPTIFELRGSARFSLGVVIENEESSCNAGTGGFNAYKFPWGIELVFSVERRSSY
jgi:hypothetical protein